MQKNNKKGVQKKDDGADDFKFEILNHVGVLGVNSAGWRKELNIVKWNDAQPKMDIREWDPDHERMSRGASLNIKETEKLRELLASFDISSFETTQPLI
jgi:hypothetical protein